MDPDNITIVLGDQFNPDTMSKNTDGTCTCLIRYHGLTIEDLNYLVFGPISHHRSSWQGLKSDGKAELLDTCQEMGKKVYLLVLSGTEVVEGGPVSIVNSQQTLFSQFCNKGLYLTNLTNTIGCSTAAQGTSPPQGLAHAHYCHRREI